MAKKPKANSLSAKVKKTFGTSKETKPEPTAPVKETAVKSTPKASQKGIAKMGFAVGIVTAFDSSMEPAELAKDCLEYAGAMVELSDSNILRSELAVGAIINIIRTGETPENASKFAFEIADEIIKQH